MNRVIETEAGDQSPGPAGKPAEKRATGPIVAPVADIALLLEGTYPYVRGGVSSWVHQIISALPEIRFAVVFIGSDPSMYGPVQYQYPANVTHVETHYLLRQDRHGKPGARAGNRRAFAQMDSLHEYLRRGGEIPGKEMMDAFTRLGSANGISQEDFLYSRASWEYITEQYRQRCTEPSFVDYFWAVRAMHAPLFVLARIAAGLPPVRAVHAISTGYAGLLGSMIRLRREIPFVLTEHGIYTKERKIDLAQATWLHDHNDDVCNTLHDEMGYIRGLWIRFYEQIGRMAYGQASPIVSLYEGNRQRQIADGAAPERTRVITNGISLERYRAALERRPETVPPVLGLVGRVVPIKDIKTFIRTLRILVNRRPDIQGWIVGPEDEDQLYVTECKELATSLGLNDNVKFLGFQNVLDILPQLGLMVLTSISEALPLVVLEAFASGLPCLATDVGSCRELIEGRSEEDWALGAAGSVVPIADPQGTAEAALELLNDAGRWRQAQQAGLARVARYYDDKLMFSSYRNLYMETLAPGSSGTSGFSENAGCTVTHPV
ncbi:glycosyltransferase involved in cell wall biosynthesis [Nitrosospira sp. Nsp2]|uniref:GT4 family glycosyltransferase PelF n=1 Tax=Nitrosospira sp. Nsp2 TaxID=136548 RepID=UPI000D31D2B6|nr:GT4 family glycosyltransferase PelF [Nitrosospira sp. Nsp2]PTR17419.1 glycosyltransferase involved in cell wall biosynthesis [Nitrosospira sp. Nsp2]